MAFDYFVFARAVRNSGFFPSERLVLLAIGLRADSLGECYPGQRLIAHDTGLTRRSVGRVLEHLTEKGAIVVQKRAGRSTNYRIGTWDTMSHGVGHGFTCDTVSHGTPVPMGCDTMSHGGGTPVPMGCDTMSPDLPTDPPIDLPTHRRVAHAREVADVEGSEPGRTTPTPGPQADCAGCSEDPAAQGPLCAECLKADPEIGTEDRHRGSGDRPSGSQAGQHPSGHQAGERKRPARRHPRQQSYSGGLLNEDAEAIHEMLAQRQANVDDRVGFANYIAGHLGLQGGNKLTLARVRIMLDKVCGKAGARAAAAGDGAGPTSDDIADHTETWLSKPAEWWKDVEKKRAAEKQADEPAQRYPVFKDDEPMERLSKEESVANAKRVRAMIAGAGIGNGGMQRQ